MNKTARFIALLGQFGIKFPDRQKEDPKSGRRVGFGLSWYPLRKEEYYVDGHGTLHRRSEKRRQVYVGAAVA